VEEVMDRQNDDDLTQNDDDLTQEFRGATPLPRVAIGNEGDPKVKTGGKTPQPKVPPKKT
jgi:hypothetical protein